MSMLLLTINNTFRSRDHLAVRTTLKWFTTYLSLSRQKDFSNQFSETDHPLTRAADLLEDQ